MYQEISLRLNDGSEQKFPFLATGTTAYRYKQVFHQDLMILLNKMENSEDDQTDMTVGDKLAFIMNAQAEKRDMNTLNVDAFLEWADQFDGAELFLHMQAKKRSLPTDREINTAVYMLRAKQMGLSIAELDQMEEGMVIDMIIEAGNDLCEDEYCQVADQHAFDVF